MILRKLADAIREQNWFTVIVEIFIVVIGIFLGLQVTEWNESRKDGALEQKYLTRLHSEIEDLIQAGHNASGNLGIGVITNELSRYERLQEVGQFLIGEDTAKPMEQRHCRALYRSHIYFSDTVPMPTIDEMLSTGRILLIGDDELRTKIIRFSQAGMESSLLMDNIRNDRLLLSRIHPELIQLKANDAAGSDAFCDFEAMRGKRSFINDFADNLGRYRAYSELILKPQLSRQQTLHERLDTALNLVH
ncbi:hypothetical protein [Kordiimonas aquimaris]|uniref:hypothetical protein n=1 Tax=Kordiimonas aquimaris TaxID=707591 RepID=UPI0021CE82F0|nr:hypothetical protein [Kordiimonas aquimaris]